MDCEMCGEGGASFLILVEGAKLRVCSNCAKYGKVISAPFPPPKKAVIKKEKPEVDVVADYGRRIREAREKMKIDRKVLAELVNEKESFLERVENEKALPNATLGAKLEKVLGVKLFEEIKHERVETKKEKKRELTLGDVVVVKKK